MRDRAALYLVSVLVTGCTTAAAPEHTSATTVRQNTPTVALISSGALDMSDRLVDATLQGLEYPVVQFVLQADSRPDAVAKRIAAVNATVIVALGGPAYYLANTYFPQTPLVYSLVVRDDKAPASQRSAGVSIDLSATTEFMMYRLVIPTMRTVVAFYTSGRGEALAQRAQQELLQIGLDLQLISVADTDDLGGHAALTKITHADAVWLFNDPGLMTEKSFTKIRGAADAASKPLLCSSFREFAVAGAMMAATLNFQNIGSQVAALVAETIQKGDATAGGLFPPVGAHLVVNTTVAARLGIEIPPQAEPLIYEFVSQSC